MGPWGLEQTHSCLSLRSTVKRRGKTHLTHSDTDRHTHSSTSILTGEARATGADVSAGHVLAGASVHTRVGFTLVVVDVAVLAAPAGVAQAVVADVERERERERKMA